jgi:hypothetical protein
MGKRTTMESEKQPTGKEIRLAAKATVKTFDSAFSEAKETIDQANEDLKTAAGEAKSKHLNLWAFKTVRKLFDDFHGAENEALASEKLAIKLAQFDELRKQYKLDELAGLQGRLFAEGEIGGSEDVNGVPREVDEDGEDDPRPTHLRRPGASAASVVQDLAAKSGAKTSDDPDPIDGIGRGKPH